METQEDITTPKLIGPKGDVGPPSMIGPIGPMGLRGYIGIMGQTGPMGLRGCISAKTLPLTGKDSSKDPSLSEAIQDMGRTLSDPPEREHIERCDRCGMVNDDIIGTLCRCT